MTLKLPAFRPTFLAFAAMAFIATAAQAQTAQPTRVATANIQKIFSEIQEIKDLNAKWKNEGANVEAQNQEKKQKIRDLEAAREALKPDSPAYQQKNDEWMKEYIDYQAWVQITQVNRVRQQNLQTLQIFNKIQAAVAEVATQRGIDLVMTDQHPEVPENAQNLKPEEVKALIGARNILYVNGQIDITADVIANLDAKYKSGK
jgi:Skp family chaperone for outer membrane proteins